MGHKSSCEDDSGVKCATEHAQGYAIFQPELAGYGKNPLTRVYGISSTQFPTAVALFDANAKCFQGKVFPAFWQGYNIIYRGALAVAVGYTRKKMGTTSVGRWFE